jgi:hypothetical protein
MPLLGRQQRLMTALLQGLRDGVHGDDVAERAFGDDEDAAQYFSSFSVFGILLFEAVSEAPKIVLIELKDAFQYSSIDVNLYLYTSK